VSNTKISALPAATAALGTDELPINEAGLSKKLTVTQIQTLIVAGEWAYTSGTSFPAGAALTAYGSNRPFFRTDLGQWYYYDGTRWLSAAEYRVDLVDIEYGQGGDTAFSMGAPMDPTFPMWATRAAISTYAGTNNVSNYWTVQLASRATTTHNLCDVVRTANDTQAQWINHLATINAAVTVSDEILMAVLAKIGSPAEIFLEVAIYYRLIAT
jgi:hypothetical protein